MKDRLNHLQGFLAYLYHKALCTVNLHEFRTETAQQWPTGKNINRTMCPHCGFHGEWDE